MSSIDMAIQASPTSSTSSSTRDLVIDVFVRVSLLGLEIVTIDIHIVVASVDTFLQFAEAVNRLDLYGVVKNGDTLAKTV